MCWLDTPKINIDMVWVARDQFEPQRNALRLVIYRMRKRNYTKPAAISSA